MFVSNKIVMKSEIIHSRVQIFWLQLNSILSRYIKKNTKKAKHWLQLYMYIYRDNKITKNK